MFRRSQQWDALSAEEALRRDPRAPVSVSARVHRRRADGGPRLTTGRIAFSARRPAPVTLTSPEQELAFILQRVGPVVAIGKPGERLPELGAARIYVSHESWQQTVLEMLERSSLVLARVGASPGVLWELDQRAVAGRAIEGRASSILGFRDGPGGRRSRDRGAPRRPLPLPSPPASRFAGCRWVAGRLDPQRSIGVLVGFDHAGRAVADAHSAMTAYGPSDLVRTADAAALRRPAASRVPEAPHAHRVTSGAIRRAASSPSHWRWWVGAIRRPLGGISDPAGAPPGGSCCCRSSGSRCRTPGMRPCGGCWPTGGNSRSRSPPTAPAAGDPRVRTGGGCWHKHCFLAAVPRFLWVVCLLGVTACDGSAIRPDGRPERAVHAGRRRHGHHRRSARQAAVRRGSRATRDVRPTPSAFRAATRSCGCERRPARPPHPRAAHRRRVQGLRVFQGLRVELKELQPYPFSSRTIAHGDYKATLTVTQNRAEERRHESTRRDPVWSAGGSRLRGARRRRRTAARRRQEGDQRAVAAALHDIDSTLQRQAENRNAHWQRGAAGAGAAADVPQSRRTAIRSSSRSARGSGRR